MVGRSPSCRASNRFAIAAWKLCIDTSTPKRAIALLDSNSIASQLFQQSTVVEAWKGLMFSCAPVCGLFSGKSALDWSEFLYMKRTQTTPTSEFLLYLAVCALFDGQVRKGATGSNERQLLN